MISLDELKEKTVFIESKTCFKLGDFFTDQYLLDEYLDPELKYTDKEIIREIEEEIKEVPDYYLTDDDIKVTII
jgi:predicted DNA-binding protein